MADGSNFVDYIFCPNLLSQEVDAIPTLEGKKAFAKKWIGSFLNNVVMGIPKTTGCMEFCPSSFLPKSISYYKLTIRQQLLCKFVTLLMDRACLNLQEFEEIVPEMYQYMALAIAISLANPQTAASYSGLQDLSKDPSETGAKPLPQPKSEDLFFYAKPKHERPEMLFRFWAMRTFCKLTKSEPQLGDVNMHFKLAADVCFGSGTNADKLSVEAYCEGISCLAPYSFYLNQFDATIKMVDACFAKKAEVKPCGVDWEYLDTIRKACHVSKRQSLPSTIPKEFSQMQLAGIDRQGIHGVLEYMQQNTRLLKTPPPSLIHLRSLFRDCWEIGCPNVACVYYLRWFLQKLPTTRSDRIAVLNATPTSLFYQLRTQFEGRPDLHDTLCLLIPAGPQLIDSAMDDAQASQHAALVDDFLSLINLSGANMPRPKDEEQLPPPNTSANSPSGVAVKKLLNVLRSNNPVGRQLEAYLLRGIQSYRQGRFEEALSLVHLILTSRPPSRDRSSGRLSDAQVCIATAQQIRTYSKISLFLLEGSEAHRPTDADLSVLIPDKELLFPTQSDLERVASYYLKHDQYLGLSKQYSSLAETFANEAESLAPISCVFFSLLGQLFDKVFAFFRKEIRELGIDKITSASSSDIAKLQEIKDKAMYLLDCTAKTKVAQSVIESAIRALTSIDAHECIYVLCGVFYSYALKSCPLQPFVFNANCFGAMALIMASPSFLPSNSKCLDVVNKIKSNASAATPSSTHYSELFLPLAISSLPYLPKKVEVCLGLFQAYALNGLYRKALQYFWEYASLVSLCFSSLPDLQVIFKSTNFSLALTCMQKLGAPTLLAVILQLKRETLYAEAFDLLSKTSPQIVSESYIPFLCDATLVEYLCGYVWKDSPSTRKLLAAQLSNLPQGQTGSSHLPEHLIQKLLINIENDYLS